MDEFLKRLLRAVAVALGMAYVVLGAMLIYFDSEWIALAPWVRITFGILLVVYGLYRTVRASKKTIHD